MTDYVFIEDVHEYGETIKLMDGTIWQIKSGDMSKAAIWHATQRIVVQNNDNDIYPHRLKNLDTSTEEEIEATKIK